VVKKLIEAMNGAFGVESKVGVGSCFWIELPRNTAMQNEQNIPEQAVKDVSAPEAQGGHILYVEDNWANIELVREILSYYRPKLQLSVRVKGAEADEAVALLRPDLVLLDLNLPDMHGSEILQMLKENKQNKHIPVIIVSADAMPLQREKMIQAGALDYLSKPINVKLFLHIIDKVLEGSSE
jgi:CheY-like chemotaxis protein